MVGLFCKLGIADRFVGTVELAGGRIDAEACRGDDFPAPPGLPVVTILYGEDGDRSLPWPCAMLEAFWGWIGVPITSLCDLLMKVFLGSRAWISPLIG